MSWESSLLDAYAEKLKAPSIPKGAFTTNDLAARAGISPRRSREILATDFKSGKLDRIKASNGTTTTYFYFKKP